MNYLVNGECLEEMDKMIYDGIKVDMILCDLPYGSTKCKWDNIIPFTELWKRYNNIIKDNGAIVLFGSEPFASQLRLSNLKNYKYDWIWDKIIGTGFLNSKKQPMRNHENIIVFYKKQCTYNPQKTYGHKTKKSTADQKTNCKNTQVYNYFKPKSYQSNERFPRSIQVFSRDTQKQSLHPTQKPVELLRYLIRTYTNEGELILDNCMGSGSTGVASVLEKRNFIGIELDENYFQVAKKRIIDNE